MRTDELIPIWRSTIGFDRLFDFIEHQMRPFGDDSHPPYDIARVGEDIFRITLALPGYPLEALKITVEQNSLTVEGDVQQPDGQQFLYHGISAEPFKRVFHLADFVKVKGASFNDGLLQIELVRELPEAMKPRRIALSDASNDDNKLMKASAA